MDVHGDLAERVKASGERVAERLELLRILRQLEGAEELAELVEKHDSAIEAAARRVRDVLP
ncbi:MAG: hypothetical protein E2O39_05025 [Planctomycetota bacterium]|nr:MAG: hypothetical protein E2O39_05025 [Planctomycetota bacterium]